MKRRRRTRRTKRSYSTRRSKRKPIGYAKVKGGYALIFGTKKKPRVGRKFKTKKGLARHFNKKYRRR
jgi:hypothetical protein